MGNVLTTVYTIDFLSDTWIRNTLITFLLMIFYLFISLKISEKNIFTFLKISSLTVIAMTLSNHILLASTGSWELQKHLPFHLCSISAIICCVIFFVKKNQFLFEFLFYAGILGGIFSILTPQITLYNENYFFYVLFYFKHAVIIIIPIVAIPIEIQTFKEICSFKKINAKSAVKNGIAAKHNKVIAAEVFVID